MTTLSDEEFEASVRAARAALARRPDDWCTYCKFKPGQAVRFPVERAASPGVVDLLPGVIADWPAEEDICRGFTWYVEPGMVGDFPATTLSFVVSPTQAEATMPEDFCDIADHCTITCGILLQDH